MLKHSIFVKNDLFWEKIRFINTLCEQDTEFLNIKVYDNNTYLCDVKN
jgi:hypothetical protein